MTLKATITEDMKAAMRARETARLSTIRLPLAGIIDKMIKQRRESIAHFDAGGRSELSAAERAEIELLRAYLPQPLSATEVEALIAEAIADAGVSGPAAMGKVMAALRPRLAGRADMALVADRVKAKLAG